MIWTLAGLKGGTGKTTLAANLAAEAERRGARALLIDATFGQSLRTWADAGGFAGPVVSLDREASSAQIQAMALGFDLCLIDTQSADLRLSAAAAAVSQRVLVPCGASPLDVWPLLEALEVFRHCAARVQVVINGHDPRTSLGKQVCDDLRSYGVDLVTQSIARRAIHAEAMAHGSSSPNYELKSAGAQEMVRLFDTLQQPAHSAAGQAVVLH